MPQGHKRGASEGYRCPCQPTLRLAAVIFAVTGFVITTAGCAGPVTDVRLPAKGVVSPAASIALAVTNTPAATTPRQQVLAAIAGYTTALGQAEDSRSGALARKLLRPYLAVGPIEGLVQAMNAIWARGESFTGQDIRHVSSVTVVGRHAFVHDCDDTSGMALVDAGTGEIVPGSSGTSHENLVTRLDLVSGRWLVQFQLLEDVPCMP